jgi:hypothetical protein
MRGALAHCRAVACLELADVWGGDGWEQAALVGGAPRSDVCKRQGSLRRRVAATHRSHRLRVSSSRKANALR